MQNNMMHKLTKRRK